MRSTPLLIIALTAALAGAVIAGRTERPTPEGPQTPPPAPVQRLGVSDLLAAVPFELDEPYRHAYRSEQPSVSRGFLVVLRVDPDLVQPTDQFSPVLYAGAETVESMNHGHMDGVRIGLVPDATGSMSSLMGQPIWFGDANLPERVDAQMAEAQLGKARAAHAWSPDSTTWARARTAGGTPLRFVSRDDLDRAAAELMLRFAPGERDLAESILGPQ